MGWMTSVQGLALRSALRLPAGARAAWLGAPPRNDRGTPLDLDLHTMLRLQGALGHRLTDTTPAQARRNLSDGIAIVAPHAPGGVVVTEATIAGRPARTYAAAPDAPVLLWLHGGGWAAGDLDSHDTVCRRLAHDGGVNVVALDYRRAPEAPFPAALDDTTAAWAALPGFASAHGWTGGRLWVGGDSAGGNLSAALCVRAHRDGFTGPERLVLAYPGLDFRRDTPSHRLFARGYLLEAAGIDVYERWYAIPSKTDPLASPGPAQVPFPPAIVLTAGFDPLRDEGEAFAARVPGCVHVDAADMVHGFLHFDAISASAAGWIAQWTDAVRVWATEVQA
jgi:acetyl esterase